MLEFGTLSSSGSSCLALRAKEVSSLLASSYAMAGWYPWEAVEKTSGVYMVVAPVDNKFGSRCLRQETGCGTSCRQEGFWDSARCRRFTWEDVSVLVHGA